jgi:hypothetical protein
VLAVLARAPPRGRDVNALLTLGFKLETIADLILSGQATIRIEIVKERSSKNRGCLRPDHERGPAVAESSHRSREGIAATGV